MICMTSHGHKGAIVTNLEPHPRYCVCPLAMNVDLFKRIVFLELLLPPNLKELMGRLSQWVHDPNRHEGPPTLESTLLLPFAISVPRRR